jgi:hypothetical protein
MDNGPSADRMLPRMALRCFVLRTTPTIPAIYHTGLPHSCEPGINSRAATLYGTGS